MTREARSIPPAYFVKRYEEDPDPWRFASSPYEQRKYTSTLAAMPRPHYANALEVGCSIGVLTEMLARRSDRLVAVDVAEPALALARERCAPYDNIVIGKCCIPQEWPEGSFDLILFSEVLYYLDEIDLLRVVSRTAICVAPKAHVILVHWTGETDYPLSGDEAAGMFIRAAGNFAKIRLQKRTPEYRLDLLQVAS